MVKLLAERLGVRLRRELEPALSATATVEGQRLALALPLTYMNDSGLAVRPLVRRLGLSDPSRLVVVHDELDLPVGVVRIKAGGGLAGHNGLRSIRDHLGRDDFTRVRIGIGKPPGGKESGADHVLSAPPKQVRQQLDAAVQEAAEAVLSILVEGVSGAQSRFNGRRD